MTDLSNSDYNQPANAKSPSVHPPATPIFDNGMAYEVVANLYSGDDAEQSPHDGSDEILALRSQLLAQQRAILEARRAAGSGAARATLDHQRQLKKAQEEAAKAKAEAEKIKRQAEDAANSMARELQFVADRSRPVPPSISDELAKERERLAARIASLESEVVAAREKKPVRRWRDLKFWLQFFTLLLLLAVLVRVCVSPSLLSPAVTETWQPPSNEAKHVTADLNPTLGKRLNGIQNAGSEGMASDRNPGFEDAIQRIMVTVAAFPDRSFQDLVAEANRDRAASAPLTCPFSMDNTGALALIFDKNDRSPNPLVSGLERCADGLEKLRAARK